MFYCSLSHSHSPLCFFNFYFENFSVLLKNLHYLSGTSTIKLRLLNLSIKFCCNLFSRLKYCIFYIFSFSQEFVYMCVCVCFNHPWIIFLHFSVLHINTDAIHFYYRSLTLHLRLKQSFAVVQSPSHVQLCNPMTAACQASLSLTTSWSLPNFMSIESIMPSNYLRLVCLLILPSNFPSIRGFSNESALCIRWPKFFQLSPLKFYIDLLYYFFRPIIRNSVTTSSQTSF